MLNLVAKHLKPTEIGSLRESFLAMVRRRCRPLLLLQRMLGSLPVRALDFRCHSLRAAACLARLAVDIGNALCCAQGHTRSKSYTTHLHALGGTIQARYRVGYRFIGYRVRLTLHPVPFGGTSQARHDSGWRNLFT